MNLTWYQVRDLFEYIRIKNPKDKDSTLARNSNDYNFEFLESNRLCTFYIDVKRCSVRSSDGNVIGFTNNEWNLTRYYFEVKPFKDSVTEVLNGKEE